MTHASLSPSAQQAILKRYLDSCVLPLSLRMVIRGTSSIVCLADVWIWRKEVIVYDLD